MDHLLFLDDDRDRHAHFRARVEALGYRERHRLIYVFTAAEAISALQDHEGEIAQAFLDHDLCEDDHWVVPGAPSRVPTGMAVVDHIVTMRRPPPVITVHSFNYQAALAMCARLAALPRVAVKRIPFSQLLCQL
ncbi:MAG TPA: cyclic-phosphate processing receiver domain-containing protein [Kofleriaceae bacterium]|nr:cyclic-phosphate processing receiver domain-containing protein [Kofleriaceae bacterium]HMG53955.1 cyclic-phosphate processing receiver domain-containing protein [Kofleriaceae bacterium]